MTRPTTAQLNAAYDQFNFWYDKAKRLDEELAKAEDYIAELEASHAKLRDAMAGIHNTIRMDVAYTPLAAILNAAKRAYEESASAAGIKLDVQPAQSCEHSMFWDASGVKRCSKCDSAELDSSGIAPGILRCTECSFVLTKNIISVTADTITTVESEPEPCPNGCRPLQPVSWKALGIQLMFSAKQGVTDLLEAKKHIAELEFIRTSADKVQREFADELGCAGDNESILQAIENLKQLAESRTVTVTPEDANEVREQGNQFLVVRHPGKVPVIKHPVGHLEDYLLQILKADPSATIDIVTHRYYGAGGQFVKDADEYLHEMGIKWEAE